MSTIWEGAVVRCFSGAEVTLRFATEMHPTRVRSLLTGEVWFPPDKAERDVRTETPIGHDAFVRRELDRIRQLFGTPVVFEPRAFIHAEPH